MRLRCTGVDLDACAHHGNALYGNTATSQPRGDVPDQLRVRDCGASAVGDAVPPSSFDAGRRLALPSGHGHR